MRLALPVYYKRISITGIENIPKEGPVILACNHPNSFLDAILLGTYSPRPLNFLTRSDVFNARWKRWLLSKMHMVPIYRMRDGIENLDKNQETFEKCREVLGSGGVILIFSEGLCIQEFKLRALKKGTARIALDFAQHQTSLSIVAVGLNYLHPMQFRKEVCIGMAPPFNALDFANAFIENPAKGILAFNSELTNRLRSQVIHIENREIESAIQQAFELLLNEKTTPLANLVAFAPVLEHACIKDRQKTKLGEDIIHYRQKLKKHRITDATFTARNISLPAYLMSYLLLIPGFLLSLLPFYFTRNLTRKKVRLKEFHDSVMVAAGMVVSLIFGIIYFAIALYTGWIYGVVAIFVLVALTVLSPRLLDTIQTFEERKRFHKTNSDVKNVLITERKKLLAAIRLSLSLD